MSNVLKMAASVAEILESDLVVAAQLKEHIRPERLKELLGLEDVVVKTPDLGDIPDAELVGELVKRWNDLTPSQRKQVRNLILGK